MQARLYRLVRVAKIIAWIWEHAWWGLWLLLFFLPPCARVLTLRDGKANSLSLGSDSQCSGVVLGQEGKRISEPMTFLRAGMYVTNTISSRPW